MESESEKTRASHHRPEGDPPSEEKTGPQAGRFRQVGQQVDRAAQEAERLIAYLNNEVVPAVRQHSSSGLRKAAEKLAEFANYLDSKQRH